MWLTDEELALGAAGQDFEWGVRGYWDKSTRANAPGILAEAGDVANHLEGVADPMMLPWHDSPTTDPRRDGV